ncbi:polysaccharide pyruvyl transferase family protein [Ruminococcus albus]|uniref:polysaccharide pyruvyl transferase family protein n=1 Tax=Ruminococcus albus TaxID=1264 RepID=UPI0001E0EF01|nr:polysaccharide pyruvyl transferase family protein [Ruminococcus albus]
MLINRIGIITFHFAYNYGAVLQALALSNFLTNNSYNVKIINYYPPELHHEYSLNPFDSRSKGEILGKAKLFFKRKRQYALFDNFVINNLTITDNVTKDKLGLLNSDFDCFITGSDQVWNDAFLNDSSPYFLSFVDSEKMSISYAASFGNKRISNEISENIKKYLPLFSWVSVRERFGVNILNLSHINSDLVIDPVFLLSLDEWLNFQNENVKEDNFIF